jgi:hypothetical protein
MRLPTSAAVRRRVLSTISLFLLCALVPLAAAAQITDLQFTRPPDQSGLNVFESPKADTVEFDGFDLNWGAAFTQQFQGLTHSNAAAPQMVDGQNVNALPEIGSGFNLATANLYLAGQLADGISVHLTTYLSSRHHPEAWVKGGYLQVNKLPMFDSRALDRMMDLVTVKVGHFEINYGDTHFRRSDNGNALHNPFVGNYIVDAFTTEIGGEVYVRPGDFLLMGAITGGEIKGAVTAPDARAPSFYGKVGYDGQVTPDLRLRLTGSAYTTSASLNNTLHSGDRAGSRYYSVMGGGDWSGRVRPGIRDEVTAFMVNPFVKFKGLELFGTFEWVDGNSGGPVDRSFNQVGVEAVYRFLNDDVYVGGRYNVADGELFAAGTEVSVDRVQVGGGWFITPNVLFKAEYVTQTYSDYPTDNLFHDGEFDGVMIEGVVAF